MKNQKTFRLRIPAATLEDLDVASQRTGLNRQNVCRLAVSLGLTLLEEKDYHIEAALKARAELRAADFESPASATSPALPKNSPPA